MRIEHIRSHRCDHRVGGHDVIESGAGSHRAHAHVHSIIDIRRSTDVLATNDEDVVRAVRFIHENAFGRLLAKDVLVHVSASRASLEPRMRQVLRRTIHEEIQHVRIERAKELLATTGLEIKQVAQQSGFRYVSYMTRVFRRVLGETPARYRARMRR